MQDIRMNPYRLETIEEDPHEAESRLASKISFKVRPDTHSEYNLRSAKNLDANEKNLGINDFESYNGTEGGGGSIGESNNYFNDGNIDIFTEKK